MSSLSESREIFLLLTLSFPFIGEKLGGALSSWPEKKEKEKAMIPHRTRCTYDGYHQTIGACSHPT